MDNKIMERRIRQLLALDLNACDIYTKLAGLAQTQAIKNAFLSMAADDKMHAKAENDILKLIL